MNVLSVFIAAAFAATAVAFMPHASLGVRSNFALRSTAAKDVVKTVDAPDFYWKYRLDRLAGKMSDKLVFNADSYPDVKGYEALYNAYYLDLCLNGKLEGFDWVAEKSVTDDEWIQIYNSIADWTESMDKQTVSPETLPENDFDLLKQFYPKLDMRDLELAFDPSDVGADFPYKNMKEMLAAAAAGKLKIPDSYKGSTGNLDASETLKELKELKERSMATVDKIFEELMAAADSPFVDDEAKEHYKALRTKLADFPSDQAGWDKQRAEMEKQIDEMARLASKKVDHHGHGHHDAVSPSEEFKAKYGRSLEEMQERMNKFKADPVGFMEKSIIEKYGQEGLRVWKKSQEFSDKMSVMSEADKKALETDFADFLKQA